MTDLYDVGLGHNDFETRKKADSDLYLFGMVRQKILRGFLLGLRLLIGRLLLLGGLLEALLTPHTIHWIFIRILNLRKLLYFGKVKMVNLE